MRRRRTVVLSDLHLGPVGPLTIFRDQQALCGFLERLAHEEGPLEVILAGDTFDFLACPGYERFDPRKAPERLQTILQNNREVVTALGRLASRHKLTIFAGNHDPEVSLPQVHALLARELEANFGTDELLIPGPGEHPAVFGRWLAGREVAVVHGDRWDPHNVIPREKLLREGSIDLPTGSQLVVEILSKLQPHRPWIYELKPEIPTVLPLLLYLEPQRTWGFVREKTGLTLQMLGGMLMARMHTGPLFGASTTQPDFSTDLSAQVVDVLAEGLLDESEEARSQLQALLLSHMRQGPAGSGTLAEHDGVARLLLRTWLRLVRRTERFGTLDSPDAMPAAAAIYLSARFLVAGHTHGARYHSATSSTPNYVNTGTWVPIGRLPDGPIREVLERMEANVPWPAEAPRTFAMIEEDPLEVWLGACDADGTPRRLHP